MKRNTILVDDGEKYLFFIVLTSIEKLIGHIADVPLYATHNVIVRCLYVSIFFFFFI